MFFKKFLTLSFFLVLFLSHQPRALSYNFLYINPTTGAPIGWEPGTTIHYYVDPGPLGRLTNEQARTLIRAAMDIWENASPYADTPRFVYEGLLPEDVDGTNYQDYVSHRSCYSNDLESCPTQTQKDLKTVIIFDENGSILNNELCSLTGCRAYADASVVAGSASNPGYAIQGIAVFDGRYFTDQAPAMVGTFVHEFGHLLGLAHTYLNQQLFTVPESSQLYPTMELLAASPVVAGEPAITLTPDDITGITTLYPSAAAATDLGSIKGKILKADGTPMMHVNVIARNNEDPLCEAYSFLSGRICPEGYQATGGDSCSRSITDVLYETSDYNFSNLPPGTYSLEVEEISNEDIAFVIAPGLLNPHISGDAEFYNIEDSSSELNTNKSLVTISAGEVKEGLNIVLNRSEVTPERIKYLPLSLFSAGPNTRCPATPTIDYNALIGINDSSSTPAASCTLTR